MTQKFTYSLILLGSLSGPVALSFDRKVAFVRQWKTVFAAAVIPALIFIIWDVYFTDSGVWSFSKDHVMGVWLMGLPLEEILFFLVVPFCCMFIYACIRAYFPGLNKVRSFDRLLIGVALLLLTGALFWLNRDYTSWTAILLALQIGAVYTFPGLFPGFRSDYFLLSYSVMLIPFLVVNGFLTAIPVVMYNAAENLDIRIYTIPVEDVFYGMLLVLMNVLIYERLRNKV